jgi:putative hydrolase
MTQRDPVADLRSIAFQLERAGEATYRVRAFRSAAAAVSGLAHDELVRRAGDGSLTKVSGIGEVTARCVAESLAGEEPVYLRRLLATAALAAESADGEQAGIAGAANALRLALRGDCHSHSDWSDGGSPIEEMALAAVGLGHEYLVITDHSPTLTVARGLTPDRLRQQLKLIDAVNAALPDGFRLLTGIEVDILADGSLDQEDEMLAQLDVVVGSIHSGLRDDRDAMTRRMLAAIRNPHLDILGHCTGRKLAAGRAGREAEPASQPEPGTAGEAGADGGKAGRSSRRGRGAGPTGDRAHAGGRSRPESTFDAAAVFAACVEYDKAVEINCRPDRLDPPKRLLRLAVEAGCRFAIDTDAHAPGQLDWLGNGCERAARCAVTPDTLINAWPADRLVAWTLAH